MSPREQSLDFREKLFISHMRSITYATQFPDIPHPDGYRSNPGNDMHRRCKQSLL